MDDENLKRLRDIYERFGRQARMHDKEKNLIVEAMNALIKSLTAMLNP